MAVLEPLKVRIENWDHGNWSATVTVPDFPAEPHRGSHSVDFDDVIYIDQTDFREVSAEPHG